MNLHQTASTLLKFQNDSQDQIHLPLQQHLCLAIPSAPLLELHAFPFVTQPFQSLIQLRQNSDVTSRNRHFENKAKNRAPSYLINTLLSMTSPEGGYPHPPSTGRIKKSHDPLYLNERASAHAVIFHHGFQAKSTIARYGTRTLAVQRSMFHLFIGIRHPSVARCRVMPCCGKFLHKRCFKKANEQSFQCGHCRRPCLDDSNDTISVDDDLRANEHLADSPDDPPIWVLPPDLAGPTPLERARNAISDHRAGAMAHTLHQEGTSSWDTLPFPIDPLVWYIFWVQLDWFISTSPDGRNPVYIHASVNTPIEPTQEVRKTFYRLVKKLIPGAVYLCLQEIVHGEHFTHIADYEREGRRYAFDRNEVTVTNILMT